MTFRKITALLLAAALMLTLPLFAAAKTYETNEFSVTVPDDTYCFTPDTPVDDVTWALAGVGEPMTKLNEYLEMGGVFNFVSRDKSLNILVARKESDYSRQIYNMAELSEEELQQVVDRLTEGSGEFSVMNGIYRGGEVPFFTISVSGELEGATQYEVIYGTIINGAAFTLDLYGGTREIEEEQLSALREMVDSVHFKEIRSRPVATTADVVKFVLLVVLLLAMVATPFVMIPIRNRKDKKKKARLAQQLEEYRKAHGDSVTGEMRFANSTECTGEAIKAFSIYQAYFKDLISVAGGAVLALACVAVVFAINAEWWMKLLAVGVAVYYGYKIISSPGNIERVQRKVFQRGTSSTAVYAFYDDAFRVSGVQSASVYPYVQLTDVRKYGSYLYLYYGPENAYLLDRGGFKLGEYEDFVSFISEKTGKKVRP